MSSSRLRLIVGVVGLMIAFAVAVGAPAYRDLWTGPVLVLCCLLMFGGRVTVLQTIAVFIVTFASRYALVHGHTTGGSLAAIALVMLALVAVAHRVEQRRRVNE